MKRLILVPLMLLAMAGTVVGQAQIEDIKYTGGRPLLYAYIQEIADTDNIWTINNETDTSDSKTFRILPGAELTSWHQIQHSDLVMDYTVALYSSNLSGTLPNGGAEIWTEVSTVTITDTLWTEKDWGVVEAHYIRFQIRPVNADWTDADTLNHVGIVFENK